MYTESEENPEDFEPTQSPPKASTTTRPATPVWFIANDVANERSRQVELWGQQDHPDLTVPEDAQFYYGQANQWKAENALRVEAGNLSWEGVLLEEVFEALSAESVLERREELVQAAAVIFAWIEALDRRTGGPSAQFG